MTFLKIYDIIFIEKRFEKLLNNYNDKDGRVAPMAERRAVNSMVVGSSPSSPANLRRVLVKRTVFGDYT